MQVYGGEMGQKGKQNDLSAMKRCGAGEVRAVRNRPKSPGPGRQRGGGCHSSHPYFPLEHIHIKQKTKTPGRCGLYDLP